MMRVIQITTGCEVCDQLIFHETFDREFKEGVCSLLVFITWSNLLLVLLVKRLQSDAS